MRSHPSIIAAALLMAMGCGDTAKKSADPEGPDPLEARERIAAMEDSLFDQDGFDMRQAQALVDVYKRYVLTFQRDTILPEYLFRAANVCRSMGDPQQTIMLYDRILQEYPSWEKLPDVAYLKAFVIDTDLGQKGEARRAYQRVINYFPDHPFAADARAMIDNLELTDQQLIERFQQMEKDTVAP